MEAYHGTSVKFEEFDSYNMGDSTHEADAERAFFFTADKLDAEWYADLAEQNLGGEAHILTVELDVENILTLSCDEDESSVSGDLHAELIANKLSAMDYAEENGFDAVSWPHGNESDMNATICVFDENAIAIK